MAKLKGEVEQTQIDAWKKEVVEKYGDNSKVLVYEVDGMVCYLRTVDRNTYNAAMAKVTTSPAKFTETIVDSCWLGGCDTIKKDDQYYYGLTDYVEDMIAKKKGSIKVL